MTLGTTDGTLKNVLNVMLVGEHPTNICGVQLHLPIECKVALIEHMESLGGTFKYYPAPTALPKPQVKHKAPKEQVVQVKGALSSDSERESATLCLMEMSDALTKSGDSFMTKKSAVALMRNLLATTQEGAEMFVSMLIEVGYLIEDVAGRAPLVEISVLGRSLITETTAVVIENSVAGSTLPATIHPFDALKARIKEVTVELEAAESGNREAEQQIRQFKLRITQTQAELDAENRKITETEIRLEQYRTKAKNLHNQVLQAEELVRQEEMKLSQNVGRLQLELKNLMEEMKKMVDA